ncbi:MAG: serine hydrolase domain-containing protein, partial [Saprospiraceae bacterium]
WGSIVAIAGRERGTFVYTNVHVLDILRQQQGLNFPPGDQYNYSNSNYNLLAMIVERASGQTLAQYTKENIFQPLGMKNTQWRDDYRKIVKNRAVSYDRYGDRYYQSMPFENAHGNGGMLTTTEDLLKWHRHYKNGRIGGKPFLDLQLQQGKLNNGSTLAYAGGVFIRNYREVQEISHGGLTAGYRAWLAYYPKEDISVAFLSNDGEANPEKVGGQVAQIILGKRLITPIPKTISLSQRKLRAYLGRYKSLRNDELFELELKEGGLHLKGYQTMLATSPYTFHWGASRMEFSKDLQRVLVYTGNGDSATFVRKTPTRLPLPALPQYLGSYQSTEAETTIQLEMWENQLMGYQRPDVYYLLESIYEDAFVNTKNQLFQFRRDSSQVITGFTLSTPRAQGIWFARLPQK